MRRPVPRALRHVGRKLIDRTAALMGDRGETLAMYDALGYFPNLLWPRSFNEKVVRRKLSAAPAVWTEYADKFLVRGHVQRLAPSVQLTELYLATDDPSEIALAALPERFVLKANHGSGWNAIVTDARAADEEALRAQCRRWLAMRYGADTHEAWYAAIRPRILVEEYLADRPHGVPLDFKFWVFHGRAHFVQVDCSRFGSHTRSVFDRHWVRQPWRTFYPEGPGLERPKMLDQMIEVAECLAVDSEFVRVDLYSPNDARVVFGELTFAPGAGWEPFLPAKQYDFLVGSLW